ncbi:MAG: hypothetical protein K5930_07215 [Treponemataceae bacterium]|nr:hypothetical protein [Treponemataceae bacterium]
MKELVIIPHGNTAAFLESQRQMLAEKMSIKLFSFTPLHCPLARLADKEYTRAETKKLLVSARDIISDEEDRDEGFIDRISFRQYRSLAAAFCDARLPFLERTAVRMEGIGLEPLKLERPGFCIGFTTKAWEKSLAIENPHRMTVFRLAIMDFSPAVPFPQDKEEEDESKVQDFPAFEWKLINSVWKGKQKEA